jgi:hypothetical protein
VSWDLCLVVLKIRVSLIRLSSSSSSVWSSFISCLKNSNDLSEAWYNVKMINSIKKAKSMNNWLDTKNIKLEENYTDDEFFLNVSCSNRLHSFRKFEFFSVSSSVVSWFRVFIIFRVKQRCVRESWHWWGKIIRVRGCESKQKKPGPRIPLLCAQTHTLILRHYHVIVHTLIVTRVSPHS